MVSQQLCEARAQTCGKAKVNLYDGRCVGKVDKSWRRRRRFARTWKWALQRVTSPLAVLSYFHHIILCRMQIATHAFTAQNEDELSFSPGDMIKIMEKVGFLRSSVLLQL